MAEPATANTCERTDVHGPACTQEWATNGGDECPHTTHLWWQFLHLKHVACRPSMGWRRPATDVTSDRFLPNNGASTASRCIRTRPPTARLMPVTLGPHTYHHHDHHPRAT